MTDASRDDRPTEVLPTEVLSPAPATVEAPRRRRRAGRAWIIVLAILLAIGALLVVADVVMRNIAEQRVAEQVRANLPEGVDGEIDVAIGGLSVIAQYLAGSMDHIELRAPELDVAGAPVDVAVDLRDVPPALDGPVGHVEATIEADGAAIDELVTLAGVEGGVTLGDDALAYERSDEILGIPVRLVVTATPVAAGDTVVLESVGAEVVAGDAGFDISGLLENVLPDETLEICVAEYLPAGSQVTGIEISTDHARVQLEGERMSLDEASLATTGSCS